MTLSAAVAKLETLIPALKANDANFASSLIASFKKYGGLTPKQEPWIGKLILRAEAPVVKPVFSAPLSAPVADVNVGDFAGVITLFTTAKAHLKFPKIRLVLNGQKLVLSLNGLKSKAPGAVSVTDDGKYPYKKFFGTVTPEGTFKAAGYNVTPEFSVALTALLTELASNPSRVAKDHGKLTGNCCFCNKVLGLGKEKRSVLVGFGPDCAEHYGLKAEWLAAADKAEVKASVSPEGVPTLTVSPAAQAVIEDLAASLAKATGSVSVTVTDGPLTATAIAEPATAIADTYGPNPGDVGDLEPVTVELPTVEELANAPVSEEFLSGADVEETAYDAPAPVACFFCEQETTSYKTLHGFVVCGGCVDQLK